MSASPKIVVTGFEPFGHGTENPTLEVLAQLRAATDIVGDLTTLELPVEANRLAAITSAKLDELKPDIWISLGLYTGLAVVAVERIAANVMDFPIPDNVRRSVRRRSRFRDGPRRLSGDAAGQEHRIGDPEQRHSRQDLELAVDLSVQPDDVHGAALDRREGAAYARRLHPRSRPPGPMSPSRNIPSWKCPR